MGCELAQTRLHAYLDGELDATGSADFNQHLRNCPVCAGALEEEEALRQGLQQARLYSRAPAGLKLRIEESLPGIRAQKSAGLGLISWRWFAVAMALLLAVFVGWRQLSIGNQRTAAVVAAVDAHLRSLQPGHLADVQSTDQHTVKPCGTLSLIISELPPGNLEQFLGDIALPQFVVFEGQIVG